MVSKVGKRCRFHMFDDPVTWHDGYIVDYIGRYTFIVMDEADGCHHYVQVDELELK